MKISYTAMAVAAALLAGTAAQSTTLTFDGLNTVYGDTYPLGANMTGNSQFLAYTEAGYVLTVQTTNDPNAELGAHIGDGGGSDNFSWHDDGDNLPGAYITLTKVGGGAFSLISFDFGSQYGLTLNSTYLGTGSSYLANLTNVTSVSFFSSGYSNNQLDNIVLAGGVPEPETWAMMLVGFGMAGVAVRRRQKVAVSFG